MTAKKITFFTVKRNHTIFRLSCVLPFHCVFMHWDNVFYSPLKKKINVGLWQNKKSHWFIRRKVYAYFMCLSVLSFDITVNMFE